MPTILLIAGWRLYFWAISNIKADKALKISGK
jgi:hypothetical protein